MVPVWKKQTVLGTPALVLTVLRAQIVSFLKSPLPLRKAWVSECEHTISILNVVCIFMLKNETIYASEV